MNEELSSPGPRAVCPNAWDSCQPRLTQPPRLTGPPKAPARPRSALYPKRGVAIPTQSSPSISFNFPRHDQEAIIRLERLTPSILWAQAPHPDSQFITEDTEHFCLSQQQLCFAMFCFMQRPKDPHKSHWILLKLWPPRCTHPSSRNRRSTHRAHFPPPHGIQPRSPAGEGEAELEESNEKPSKNTTEWGENRERARVAGQ